MKNNQDQEQEQEQESDLYYLIIFFVEMSIFYFIYD